MKHTLLLLLIVPGIASAQTQADVVSLSRVTVSESGWDSFADQKAILASLRDVQSRYTKRLHQHVTLDKAARIYSPRATGENKLPTGRLAWVQNLNVRGDEPKHWPQNLSWKKHRPLWLRVLKRSRRLLRVTPLRYRGGCNKRPHHWGGKVHVDRVRAGRAVKSGRWIKLDCPGTENSFYARKG